MVICESGFIFQGLSFHSHDYGRNRVWIFHLCPMNQTYCFPGAGMNDGRRTYYIFLQMSMEKCYNNEFGTWYTVGPY